MNQLPIETIISMAIAVCALLFTALSYRRTAFRDNGESAQERAKLAVDISYIRASVDDIKIDNRVIKQDVGNLQTQVARLEQSVASAHQRIDDLKKE